MGYAERCLERAVVDGYSFLWKDSLEIPPISNQEIKDLFSCWIFDYRGFKLHAKYFVPSFQRLLITCLANLGSQMQVIHGHSISAEVDGH